MHQIARTLLQRFTPLRSCRRPSKLSAQSVNRNLLYPTNPRSSLPKPYFSFSRVLSIRSLDLQPAFLDSDFRRGLCSGQPFEYGKEVDEINLKFAEAREEIDAALESKETVYFDEEAECAREAVKNVFDLYDGLLARLQERERSSLQRSMGLKMEQLKAELKQLED